MVGYVISLGIVIYMSFGINKMSSSKAQTTFWFCSLNGSIIVINFVSLYWIKCY